MGKGDGVEEVFPLKPAELNILLALAGGEMHGYGIMKDVERRTGDKLLGPGTLYRTLDGLLGRRWIEEAGSKEVDGRNRRYFRITASGRDATAVEIGRLEEIVDRARERGIFGRGFGPIVGDTP